MKSLAATIPSLLTLLKFGRRDSVEAGSRRRSDLCSGRSVEKAAAEDDYRRHLEAKYGPGDA